MCRREFIMFLADDPRSKRMIRTDLRRCIRSTQKSNKHFVESVYDRMRKEKEKLLKNRSPYEPTHSIGHYNQPKRLRRTFSDEKLSTSIERIDHVSGFDRILWILNAELIKKGQHLIELLTTGEKSNIWPANRNSQERERMQRLYRNLQILAYLSTFVLSQIALFFGQTFGSIAIANNKWIPAEMRGYSFADRLLVVDACFACLLTTYWFSAPVVMVIVVLHDQTRLIRSLEARFRALNESLDRLSRLELSSASGSVKESIARILSFSCCPHELKFTLPAEEDEEWRQNDTMLVLQIDQELSSASRRSEDELRCACDQEAIEIYISSRSFLDQTKDPMEFAQLVMLRNVFFIAFNFLVGLIFVDSIEPGHMNLFVALILMVMTIVNGAFCICASFSANSIGLMKSVFSLIAQTQFNLQLRNHPTSLQEPDTENQLPLTDDDDDDEEVDDGASSIDQMRLWSQEAGHLLDCPISSHTLLLFRKLVQDYEMQRERLVCRVAGILKLDYDNILHFNFRIISFVLLGIANHRVQ